MSIFFWFFFVFTFSDLKTGILYVLRTSRIWRNRTTCGSATSRWSTGTTAAPGARQKTNAHIEGFDCRRAGWRRTSCPEIASSWSIYKHIVFAMFCMFLHVFVFFFVFDFCLQHAKDFPNWDSQKRGWNDPTDFKQLATGCSAHIMAGLLMVQACWNCRNGSFLILFF